MKPRLGVIQFPGSNCEYETARAGEYYGFETEIIRWNIEEGKFHFFDAYILPGGFSYQDRVRAGVISSKLPIMSLLLEAAKKDKPILGICNGCQILAEAGFFPNLKGNFEVEAALTPNQKENERIGFICDWVMVKVNNPQGSIFTKYFSADDIIPIPVNHGEGRFLLSKLAEENLDKLTSFQYVTAEGNIEESFPTNINGSSYNLAGLCNAKGNILAIMPHPERAAFLKQIPTWLRSSWKEKKLAAFFDKKDSEGPWSKLFVSMRESIK